ncbi:ABC transporter substrate-binding protein [Terrihabitans sp. B22-R8]|uniref:ABC transporter substrate-binding protein n=1 Tax=Terrihabitans sp. B22-R8 TaxID=3425128 RepID=UPI00403CF5C2
MRHYRSLLVGAAVLFGWLGPMSVAGAEPRTAVNVVAPWHVSGIEPSQDGYTFQRMQVGETLVGADAKGNLLPALATSWEPSEDGLAWRFVLREGVKFHDGTALTPENTSASLNRAKARQGILDTAPITAIRPEGGAIIVELSEPFAVLPALFANYATTILAPTSFNEDGRVVKYLSTGPFRVEKVERPLSLSVARFADYWGPKPAIETATYLSAHRSETRSLTARSGDADIVFTLDPSSYDQLSKLDAIKTQVMSVPRIITLKMNLAHPAMRDLDARRALSLAVDRAAIAKGVMRFPQAEATQLFPNALPDWHDPALAPYGYDPEEAKRLLAGLGWTPGKDGVLQKDGARFSVTLRTFPNRPELPIIATVLQDQWRQLGIEVKVSVGNSSDIPSGHRDGTLEMGLYARNYALTPDPFVNVLDDFGEGGGDWGAMNWSAPDVAAALTKASRSGNPDDRIAAIRLVTQSVQNELPVLPIAYYQHTIAHNSKLEGVVVDPLEMNYGLAAMSWSK